MAHLTVAGFARELDVEAANRRVRAATQAALGDARACLAYFARLAVWNGHFGAGVAALAGKIGRTRGLFVDRSQSWPIVADRAMEVASLVFDAARDEFDDSSTRHRDAHQSLAQAFLLGLRAFEPQALSDAEVEACTRITPEVEALSAAVARGYGVGTPDDLEHVLHAMGYHVASELLADAEFTVIDEVLRAEAPALVAHLSATLRYVGRAEHQAYAWLSIHSGGGGGVEAEHCRRAVEGLDQALSLVHPAAVPQALSASRAGAAAFLDHHRRMFEPVP